MNGKRASGNVFENGLVPKRSHYASLSSCAAVFWTPAQKLRGRWVRLTPSRHQLHNACVKRQRMQPQQGASGDHDIATITLNVESKKFYFDLKENLRGKYLKISERGSNQERSTIVVPFAGIKWFEALFTYFIEGSAIDPRSLAVKQLQIESKAFFFDAGENPRGRYLRISESGAGTRGRSSLIIPAGSANCAAWASICNALRRLRTLPDRGQDQAAEAQGSHVLELGTSADTLSHYHVLEVSQLDVGGSRQLVGPGPSEPSIGETKAGGQVLRAGHKRFFFDLGSNQKGDFLRITEGEEDAMWATHGPRTFHGDDPSAQLVMCLQPGPTAVMPDGSRRRAAC